jgi:hypothetical protein
MSKLLVFLLFFCNWPLYSIIYQLCDMQGVNVGGVGEGGVVHPPQRNYPVCLKLYVQSGSKLCICLDAVLCEAN